MGNVLTGVYADAYKFVNHYASIINNGVPKSSRSELSPVCKEVKRIYNLDVEDYMKYFTTEDKKALFLFSNNESNIYTTVQYEDCIFIVVPTSSLFKNLEDKRIICGIHSVLCTILNMFMVFKQGSPIEIFKTIFAAYYFTIVLFGKCFEIDKYAEKVMIDSISSDIGDLIDPKELISAATLGIKADENIGKMFTDHGVLVYMNPETLDIIRSEMMQ
jgi:hypothetical protein